MRPTLHCRCSRGGCLPWWQLCKPLNDQEHAFYLLVFGSTGTSAFCSGCILRRSDVHSTL
jgi:hypothetical protein